MSASFVHLHTHTQYSLLDGAIKMKDLVNKCDEFKMPAVAMTDHGNVFGAVNLLMDTNSHNAKAENKVKPILGCEIYLAPFSIEDKKEIPGRKKYTHLTLLAENNEGWHHLVKIVTRSHLEGFYSKPRADRATLREFAGGIICLTGCLAGPLNEWLLMDNYEKASETLSELVDIFGKNNVYVELQDHGMPEQKKVLPQLIQLAQEHGLKTVATNDVHFLTRADHDAHDVLICIGTGRKLMDGNRMRYSSEVYLKSPEEMRELFSYIPEACDATLEIAERCNVTIKLDSTSSEKYPQFPTPDGSPLNEYLAKVCFDGLEMRYGKERATTDQVLIDRLNYELGIINQLGFASYFLITADFINWAKDHDIPVGPGRGSGAGSLVAYCMKITNICPMRFGLLFERFLNPERVSPPDIDIDFCPLGRQRVIDYVRQKYGERAVSNIITYGKLGAKSVIKDVARVLDIPLKEADAIAKQIENGPKIHLKDEYEKHEELRALIGSKEIYQQLWDYCLRLEGLVRNTGVHAAGVVIGDRPLDEHVALTRDKEGGVVAQCDMTAITEVGLLKMDFLGLKNLTVIRDAVEYIRQRVPDFDIDQVPLDDQKAFALLNAGETMGVFQLESGGMVSACRKYGISKIEDVIDLLAVYRPGAMQFLDQMIAVKKGLQKPVYEHPLLEKVCGDTYGVMIYQEQVQNAAKTIAGYSLGGADLLRRAMGKKKVEVMIQQRATFAKGAWETNQIEEKLALEIFSKIETFAGYGFNKSHSACYGHITYWTAYLKANFPVEFMSGLLSNEINNLEKIGVFVCECNRLGIEILPPDVNKSQIRFAPEQLPNGEWAIRYGLSAIKNVGEGAIDMVVAERKNNGPYESLENFSRRLDTRTVNRKVLENLVTAGAFDWTHEFRSHLFARIDRVVSASSSRQQDDLIGQGSLFDMDALVHMIPPTERMDSVPEWSKDKRLEDEKELLSFYVTGNPLDKYRALIEQDKYTRLGLVDDVEITREKRRARCAFAGMVRQYTPKVTKEGKKFAVIVLEDFTGSQEIVFWSEVYEKTMEDVPGVMGRQSFLTPGNVIALRGTVTENEDTNTRRISANDVRKLKLKAENDKKDLIITLSPLRHDAYDLKRVQEILKKYPGKTPVLIEFRNSYGLKSVLKPSDQYKVKVCDALQIALSAYM